MAVAPASGLAPTERLNFATLLIVAFDRFATVESVKIVAIAWLSAPDTILLMIAATGLVVL